MAFYIQSKVWTKYSSNRLKHFYYGMVHPYKLGHVLTACQNLYPSLFIVCQNFHCVLHPKRHTAPEDSPLALPTPSAPVCARYHCAQWRVAQRSIVSSTRLQTIKTFETLKYNNCQIKTCQELLWNNCFMKQ